MSYYLTSRKIFNNKEFSPQEPEARMDSLDWRTDRGFKARYIIPDLEVYNQVAV